MEMTNWRQALRTCMEHALSDLKGLPDSEAIIEELAPLFRELALAVSEINWSAESARQVKAAFSDLSETLGVDPLTLCWCMVAWQSMGLPTPEEMGAVMDEIERSEDVH